MGTGHAVVAAKIRRRNAACRKFPPASRPLFNFSEGHLTSMQASRPAVTFAAGPRSAYGIHTGLPGAGYPAYGEDAADGREDGAHGGYLGSASSFKLESSCDPSAWCFYRISKVGGHAWAARSRSRTESRDA